MSPLTNLSVAGLATLVAVACSSTPQEAAAPTTKTTAAPTATHTQPATVPGQINPKLVSQGYKAVKVKDDYIYCRMESLTGTSFKKRVCLTESAIRALEEETKQTQDSMTRQRTGPACFPNVNC